MEHGTGSFPQESVEYICPIVLLLLMQDVSMETLVLRKEVFQVANKWTAIKAVLQHGSIPVAAMLSLLCEHKALYYNLHYRQCRREVHWNWVHARQWFCLAAFLSFRSPLPVPGNIHYGHSWNFSYSPLELFIHCGYNITFVLKKRDKPESTLVQKSNKSLNSISSFNRRGLPVNSNAFLGLVENSITDK